MMDDGGMDDGWRDDVATDMIIYVVSLRGPFISLE